MKLSNVMAVSWAIFAIIALIAKNDTTTIVDIVAIVGALAIATIGCGFAILTEAIESISFNKN